MHLVKQNSNRIRKEAGCTSPLSSVALLLAWPKLCLEVDRQLVARLAFTELVTAT